MTVLYGTLFISVLFGLFADLKSRESSLAPNYKKPSLFFVISVALILSLVAGLRSSYIDTPTYMQNFRLLPYPTDLFPAIVESIKNTRDFGFNIFQIVLRKITANPQWLIVTTSFIINFLFILGFYKYAQPFWLAVFLYITNDIYTFSMNGIRQYIASAIIFIGLKFLLEGRFKRFLLIALIAAGFHRSAIILIPVYFIVRRKAWTKSTAILILTSIIIFFSFYYWFPAFGGFFEENSLTGQYVDIIANRTDDSVNIIRIIIAIVPVLFAFVDRKKLHAIWPESDIIVNMSILNIIFMLFGIYTTLFARLTYFTIPFQNVLLCYIASKSFNVRTRRFILVTMVVLYFVYFWYWMDVKMNFVYYSEPLGLRIG